jgi:rhamnogalacturonyl hydrolase YesR
MTDRERIEKVKLALLCMQRFPWEQGTATQGFLELGDYETAFLMAQNAVERQSFDGRLATAFYRDNVAIFGDDTTVTDPATNGEAVLYFAKKNSDKRFLEAAEKQRDWFLYNAPRTKSGVYCHVLKKKQVWVDSIFMALPFLTIIGCYEEAFSQLQGYREILRDEKTKLLSHIWDEEENAFACKDFWGVGNGWAAAGMAKMVRNMPDSMKAQKDTIIAYIHELVDACLTYKTKNNLFHNVIDDPNSFEETNLAQMICYTIYSGVHEGWMSGKYIETADKMRLAILAKVDEHGFVNDVCSSPTFAEPGTAPEGQAFFLLMEAAYNRYSNR